MEKIEITQKDIDLTADILWWLKGYRSSVGFDEMDFNMNHLRALERIIASLKKIVE